MDPFAAKYNDAIMGVPLGGIGAWVRDEWPSLFFVQRGDLGLLTSSVLLPGFFESSSSALSNSKRCIMLPVVDLWFLALYGF